MSILIVLLTVVHVLVALFLIVLVLMQKSKDQGVGAAFGGSMTDTVFGAGTTTALVRMTIWCACLLLGTTLLLAVLHSRNHGSSVGKSLIERASVPAAPAASGPIGSQPPLSTMPLGSSGTASTAAPVEPSATPATAAPAPQPTPAENKP